MTDEGKEREALLVDLRADFGEHLFFTDKALALLRAHDARIWEQAAKEMDALADAEGETAYVARAFWHAAAGHLRARAQKGGGA